MVLYLYIVTYIVNNVFFDGFNFPITLIKTNLGSLGWFIVL